MSRGNGGPAAPPRRREIHMSAVGTASAAARAAGLPLGEKAPVDWVGYVFVAFFAIPFLLFNILPVLFGTYVAFTEWSIVGAPSWVGIENFADAFADEWVWRRLPQRRCSMALIIVPGVTVLGLAFALFVNRRYPLSGAWRGRCSSRRTWCRRR